VIDRRCAFLMPPKRLSFHGQSEDSVGLAGNSSRLRFCPVAYHYTTFKRSPSTTVQIVSLHHQRTRQKTDCAADD
jgi:hypothetical protein